MDMDATLVKLECLCTRVEHLLAELQRIPEKRPSPYAKLRETFPNAGKAWSGGDLSLLFGRTRNGVRQRLERLGLIAPVAA